MKKVVLLLAIVLMAGGMVWALDPPSPGGWDSDTFGPGTFLDDTLKGVIFPGFNAVGTVSTESRYAPGFSSYVDDFIDATWYDPEAGTFFFLGGYPSDGNDVNVTDNLTSWQQGAFPYTISLGFGKSLSGSYIAAYYGGYFVDAWGDKVEANPPDDGKFTKTSESVWNNNLALLYGMGNMGFRFDLIMSNTQKEKSTYDGNMDYRNKNDGAKMALTWGAKMAPLYPYAMIGFKFPDVERVGDSDGKEAQLTYNSAFNLEVGGLYELSDTSSLWGSLTFGVGGAANYKGDKTEIINLTGFASGKPDPYKDSGAWGLDFYIHYRKALEFGNVTLKATPNLGMTFAGYSGKSTADGAPDKPLGDTWFTLSPGVNLGLGYKLNDKWSLYTGAGLTLFTWNTHGHSGGDKNPGDKDSEWQFTGIEWGTEKWTNGDVLGFGMTWAPVNGLSVGFGLNTLLDKFFVIDLGEMQIRSGNFWTFHNDGNIGGWATRIFDGLRFDLTVSYQF